MNIVLLLIYTLALLGIAVYDFKKTKTFLDYSVAGRNQKRLFVTMSILASVVGGSSTIGTTTKIFNSGSTAVWIIIVGGLALILQSILLSSKVRESKALTLPHLAEIKMGIPTAVAVSIIILITYFIVLAAQFMSISKVVVTMTGMEMNTAIVISAVVIIIYSILGGQTSVIKTDLFQFGILALALLTSVIYLFSSTPVPNGELNFVLLSDTFTVRNLIFFLAVMGASYFVCPMMFSRLLSAKDLPTAKKSSLTAGIGMLIFSVVIALIGLWAKYHITDTGGLDPLNYIIKNKLPGVLGIILAFGLLSAIVSTADTILVMMGTIIQKDILRREDLKYTRYIVGLIGLGSMGLTIYIVTQGKFGIFGLLKQAFAFYSSGVVSVVFVALMFGNKIKLNRWLSLAAVVVGGILGVFAAVRPQDNLSELFSLIGLAVSFLIAMSGVYFGEKLPEAELKKKAS